MFCSHVFLWYQQQFTLLILYHCCFHWHMICSDVFLCLQWAAEIKYHWALSGSTSHWKGYKYLCMYACFIICLICLVSVFPGSQVCQRVLQPHVFCPGQLQEQEGNTQTWVLIWSVYRQKDVSSLTESSQFIERTRSVHRQKEVSS